MMIEPPPPNPYGSAADLAHHYLAQAAIAADAARACVSGHQPAEEVEKRVRLAEVFATVGRLALDLDVANRLRTDH
ncbi:hypothetical protein ACGFW5_31030 [Streptomyces sp. NPDC048416]|uniref:hypothetical protein n=1 Tax=Streptomyces sp. NPDC048416 TaxID=3365546 RepID=UPI003716FF2D